MFLNFVFSLVFSFNVYATTGGIPALDDTDQVPCKEALTESLEKLSEESESILDQFLELSVDKATEIKRAVDAYFSVRNPLTGSWYSDEEKLLAIELVKVMEGNVTGAAKLLDMSHESLRNWSIDYEQRTATQIRNPRIQRTYSDEQRTEAVELARKEGISEASRISGILYYTIKHWLNKYKTKAVELAIREGVLEAARQLNETGLTLYRWLDEYKINAVALARKKGISEATKQLNKPEATIRRWADERGVETSNYTKKDKIIKPVINLGTPNPSGQLNISRIAVYEGVEEPGVKIGNVYTEEFKIEVVEYAKEVGVPEAAKEFNTSTQTIRNWADERGVKIKKIREIKTYTEEFKAMVVERATEVGVPKAAKEFKTSTNNIPRWAKELGVKIKKIRKTKTYTEEEKTKIVERATEVGAPKAAREFDVPEDNIRRWANKRGIQIKRIIKTYTEEFKTKAIERAKEVGAPKTAKEFNVSIVSIYNWAKERGVKIKKSIRKTYTKEFKTKAVERATEIGVPKAAKELKYLRTLFIDG